jgi:hypothetical protein
MGIRSEQLEQFIPSYRILGFVSFVLKTPGILNIGPLASVGA